MKCPSCNKFAGLDFQDPEIQSEQFEDDGSGSASVRIVRNAACCGDEMKEATLEYEDIQMPEELLKKHKKKACELSAEFSVDPIEEGGGRYAKSYFGATLTITVTCSCQKKGSDPVWVADFEEKVAASEMEELC